MTKNGNNLSCSISQGFLRVIIYISGTPVYSLHAQEMVSKIIISEITKLWLLSKRMFIRERERIESIPPNLAKPGTKNWRIIGTVCTRGNNIGCDVVLAHKTIENKQITLHVLLHMI